MAAGIPMTAEEAKAQVGLMIASSDDPEVTSEELDTLVAQAKVVDADGYAPSETDDWTPTYNLYIAVVAGWRLKAARAASRYTFQTGQTRENESDLHRHCLTMAQHYARLIHGTTRARGDSGYAYDPNTEVINVGWDWE